MKNIKLVMAVLAILFCGTLLIGIASAVDPQGSPGAEWCEFAVINSITNSTICKTKTSYRAGICEALEAGTGTKTFTLQSRVWGLGVFTNATDTITLDENSDNQGHDFSSRMGREWRIHGLTGIDADDTITPTCSFYR